MRTHTLKTWPSFFAAIERGEKTFEARRNDRDFGVGDILVLREYDPGIGYGGATTGREMRRVVTYVMRGGDFGILPGFCVLGIRPVTGTEGTDG